MILANGAHETCRICFQNRPFCTFLSPPSAVAGTGINNFQSWPRRRTNSNKDCRSSTPGTLTLTLTPSSHALEESLTTLLRKGDPSRPHITSVTITMYQVGLPSPRLNRRVGFHLVINHQDIYSQTLGRLDGLPCCMDDRFTGTVERGVDQAGELMRFPHLSQQCTQQVLLKRI